MTVTDGKKIPVTSFNVCNVLTLAVNQMHLNPKSYGQSGGTLALELKVIENIKIHVHWKLNAILSDTPKAAAVAESAFQQHII